MFIIVVEIMVSNTYGYFSAPFQQVSRRFRIFFRVFSLSSLQSMATMAASQQEREDIEGRGWQTLFFLDENYIFDIYQSLKVSLF